MTEFQKQIYNCHLATSRSIKSKPFKLRKNFDDISDEVKVNLSKIESLLNRLNYVKLNDFIIAPYKVYSKDDTFDLQFYTTQKAIKAYTIYIKQIMESNPDSDEFLKRIYEGIKWIKEFCIYNNSDIDDYLHLIDGSMPAYITHLKERRVPLYVLFYYDNFEKSMRSIDSDIIKFMFGENYVSRLPYYRTKYMASKRCKLLIQQAIKQIKQQQQNNNKETN